MRKLMQIWMNMFQPDITRFNYTNSCWWCGANANSKEHKYKKSDLKRDFGPGPYKGDDKVVRVIGGEQRPIQGPDSVEVKFEANLCQKCNNERSQSFDRAYDKFIEYVLKNESAILACHTFEWSAIFGSDWRGERLNVMRYYVKHIGCRLAQDGVLVLPELIRFLNGKRKLKFLNLELVIRTDVVDLLGRFREDGLREAVSWMGPSYCMISKSRGTISELKSAVGYRWLWVNYIYDNAIKYNSTNLVNKVVRLGEERSLTKEQFDEMTRE